MQIRKFWKEKKSATINIHEITKQIFDYIIRFRGTAFVKVKKLIAAKE